MDKSLKFDYMVKCDFPASGGVNTQGLTRVEVECLRKGVQAIKQF